MHRIKLKSHASPPAVRKATKTSVCSFSANSMPDNDGASVVPQCSAMVFAEVPVVVVQIEVDAELRVRQRP